MDDLHGAPYTFYINFFCIFQALNIPSPCSLKCPFYCRAASFSFLTCPFIFLQDGLSSGHASDLEEEPIQSVLREEAAPLRKRESPIHMNGFLVLLIPTHPPPPPTTHHQPSPPPTTITHQHHYHYFLVIKKRWTFFFCLGHRECFCLCYIMVHYDRCKCKIME